MNNDYQGRIDAADEAWRSSPWRELLKERYYISSLFCKNKIVLDSCCGTGWGTMEYIVPRANFTVGFDICESAAKTYKQSHNYQFMVMDAKSFHLKDNNFDLVLALDSIEHLTQQEGIKYLFEMKRVCKKDGIIMGTTPLVIDDCLVSIYLGWNKYHHCMYTHRSLKKVLKSIFPVVRIYEIYNKVCPYFLFICGKSKLSINTETEKIIKTFLSKNDEEFKRVKVSSYLSWTKMVAGRKKFIRAAYLFFMAGFIRFKNFLFYRVFDLTKET